jgi:predicted RNase H-related nuclease YkuK (DUF458 family)
MKKFNFLEIENYLHKISDHSKIYIGCDSMAYKTNKGVWMADYYKVVVVHIDGCHGCKIFGEISTEVDYSANKKKPTYRLMNECYQVAALYLQLAELTDKEIEVHLDFNPNKKYASNLIIEQAIGYIKGTCNVIPLVKPDAFASSYAADRLLRIKSF